MPGIDDHHRHQQQQQQQQQYSWPLAGVTTKTNHRHHGYESNNNNNNAKKTRRSIFKWVGLVITVGVLIRQYWYMFDITTTTTFFEGCKSDDNNNNKGTATAAAAGSTQEELEEALKEQQQRQQYETTVQKMQMTIDDLTSQLKRFRNNTDNNDVVVRTNQPIVKDDKEKAFGVVVTPRVEKQSELEATITEEEEEEELDDNRLTNRTLVVLIGSMRCGERAWSTLYEQVLDVNMADLAIMISDADYYYYNDANATSNSDVWEEEDDGDNTTTTRSRGGDQLLVTMGKQTYGNYPNASLLRRAKYVWVHPEYSKWEDAFDTVVDITRHPNRTFWRSDIYGTLSERQKENGMIGPVLDSKGSAGIQFMIKYWLSEKLKRLDLTRKYTNFVITRTDHYYVCPLNISQFVDLHTGTIYVPECQWWGGYQDRLYVISHKQILKSLDIVYSFLNDYKFEYYAPPVFNAETMLKAAWDRQNLTKVQKIDQGMFVCADPHKDSTGRIVHANLTAGYMSEYGISCKYCPTEAAEAKRYLGRQCKSKYLKDV